MQKRCTLTMIGLLVVTAIVLGACGPSPQASPAPPESAQPTTAAEPTSGAVPAGEPVSLRLWAHQNEGFNAGLQALADAYMAAHPNVSITLEVFDYDTYIQTLQTALPAGTEADVLQMFGSWVCSYAEGGHLAEVPADVVTMDAAESAFFSAQLAGYVCNDKLYGVPEEFNIEYGAALVNTQLAADAGLDQITNGWATWDDFIADAKQLAVVQDGVMTRAGYNFTGSDGIAATFYSLILQYGGQYLTPEGYRVNTPEGQKALALMKRFVDEGLVDPVLFHDEQNWVGDSYFEETSAIGLVGPWVIPEYAADFPEVVAVTRYVPLPTVAGDPAFVASSGWGLTVSANSKAQATAWDFVSFAAVNPENAAQWNIASGTLPALRANASGAMAEKLTAEFPYFDPFLKILQYGQHEGHFPDRDLVWYEITYPRILNFLQGNAKADETLQTIEREVNESY
jgi:multiple sugar transport system substrate-binding protein